MNQPKNEDSSSRDKTEFDDSPKCSKNSALAFSSQSDCGLVANMIPVQENFMTEEDSVKIEAADADKLCPNEYYSSVVDATCITEMHHSGGLISVTASNQNSLHEDEEPENVMHRVVSPDMSSNSLLEISEKSEGLMKTLEHSSGHENATHEHKSNLLQDDIGVKNSTATTSILRFEQQKHLLAEADCSTSMIFEAEMNQDFPFAVPFPSSNFVNLNCFRGTGNCHSELHSSGAGMDLALSSQTLFPLIPSSSPGNSYCQSLMAAVPPSFMCQSDGKFLDRSDSVGGADTSVAIQDSEVMPCSHANFAYSSSSLIASAGGDPKDNQEKEIPRKNFMELMGFGPTGAMENLSLSDGNGNDQTQTESQNAGGLFYEPPRIPTFEIPFVSCDLISSSEQQAFSPLGIRQIMMSSTPYNVWDSPSHDDSPDTILKTAAKSFICTPSITKKRQRELLSPLQEKRTDKKYERDMKHGFMYTFCISKEFSCIDSPIDENIANRISPCSAEDFLVSPTNDFKKDSGISTQPAENQDPSICHDDGNVLGKGSDASKLQEKKEGSATRINIPMKISIDIPNRRVSLFPSALRIFLC